MDGERVTRAWERYERGRAYNNRLVPNQYDLVNTNIEFFAGNQWLHLEDSPAMRALPKPTFNIIKRVASLFVASLTSSAATVGFEQLPCRAHAPDGPGQAGAAEIATAEVQNLLEKFKMDYRIREALFDGAQTGDYCAHFWWDPEAEPYGGALDDSRGEICMELVDGINVMFGNPNTPDVEKQPYILILGRDTVERLREEMRAHGANPGGDLQPDADFAFQAGLGGRTELEPDGEDGKALYVYMYEKRTVRQAGPDGRERAVQSVFVTKATRDAVIFEDVDTGLSRYPIAWGNWEKQKNQYHGRALVTGIIPNQIFINSMFAMVMRHLQLMGFPKTVYNADLIGRWNNEVGQAVGVRGLQPGQGVGQVAGHLQAADMSAQILGAIDKAVAYTKDCLGATDAQLGNVRPDNTSALMVLQSSAEVPLENTRAGLYEWLEDVAAILLDMMGTYYGRRSILRERAVEQIVTDPATGSPTLDPATGALLTRTVSRRVAQEYDFTALKRLWLGVRVNAGATTYYSEIAMIQTLDNLRRDGALELIDYLERLPDKLVPRKQELLQQLRERQTRRRVQAGGGGGAAGLLAGVPKGASSLQARKDTLPEAARKYLPAFS